MKDNINRKIRIKNVVLNVGGLAEKLERGARLLELVSESKPIKTVSRQRIPTFGIRPGLEVGCKVTITGKKAYDLLKRLFVAANNQIAVQQIGNGNAGFGVHEYIEIPGIQFQRNIGIMGFDVAITLERPGFSIKERKHARARIPMRHRISTEETTQFLKDNFKITITQKKAKHDRQ